MHSSIVAIVPPKDPDLASRLMNHVFKVDQGRWFIPATHYNREVNKIRGLGDLVHVIAAFFRLDRLANWIARKRGLPGCKCGQRRKTLNRWFPFNRG